MLLAIFIIRKRGTFKIYVAHEHKQKCNKRHLLKINLPVIHKLAFFFASLHDDIYAIYD